MKRKFLLVFVLGLFSFYLRGEIYKLRIDGPIDSLAEEYIVGSLEKLRTSQNVKLVVIELATPGGLDSSMRAIIKSIMNSPAPIAVYVSPSGARAASAGFYITLSADIAVMAPGTNTGSATPVSITGTKIEETMKKKIVNDAAAYAQTLAKNRKRNEKLAVKAVRDGENYTAEECLEKGLIDHIAEDMNELIQKLDNRTITRINGEKETLKLKGEVVVPMKMTGRQKFLRTITNPNLAYFLLIFGLIGLYLEFTHPGVLIPGVLGGISLLLAFLAFQILPINYVGLLLILLSIGFFIAEIKIQGFGILGIGGIVSFILGSVILIQSPIPEMRPAMTIILTFAITIGLVFFGLTYKVINAMKRKTETGKEGLIGEVGVAKTDITPGEGRVFVHGEWWNAVSDEPIPANSRIVVDSIDNFILKVKKKGG